MCLDLAAARAGPFGDGGRFPLQLLGVFGRRGPWEGRGPVGMRWFPPVIGMSYDNSYDWLVATGT